MPGHQSCQGWATESCGNVSAIEDNALSGQLVQVGRPDMRMPRKRVVGPRLIIRNDVDNIRCVVGIRERTTKKQSAQTDDESFLHLE